MSSSVTQLAFGLAEIRDSTLIAGSKALRGPIYVAQYYQAPADKESVQVLFRLMLLTSSSPRPLCCRMARLESTMVIQSVLGQAGTCTFGLDFCFSVDRTWPQAHSRGHL